MKIYIKNRKRRKEEFQFFMHDFVDACKNNGFKSKPDYFPYYTLHIRAVLRDLAFVLYRFIHNLFPSIFNFKKAIVITANGYTIKDIAFPYYFTHEIIPFLWDVWPDSWAIIKKDFELYNIKTVFVTARSVANMINTDMNGVKAIWIPEGIETSHYHKGESLVNRQYDVLELGRQMKSYHQFLSEMNKSGILNNWTTSIIDSNGMLSQGRLCFSNNETLYQELPKYKIMICFPRCDTNPTIGGNVETLTQRYWEAMLSGCLMIGRAPQELIDIIGYNPVIDVDWEKPKEQLQNILSNISDYQQLIEKNYIIAKKYAPWDERIRTIKEFLTQKGYDL